MKTIGKTQFELDIENNSLLTPEQKKVELKSVATHTNALNRIADKIIVATAQVATTYMEFCVYIRNNNVPPKLVSFILSERGFAKSRISEVNRVANVPDD